MMSFQVAVALWDSVVHYQTISQDQQLILVATWSCPTWVLHPSPFSDIFWAWCTCHVSCWWSRVAHRPSKFVKVVSSPSLGFVFNQQPMLQHGCLLFLLRAPADGGFDNTHTHIHIKMVDRIWQSLAMCKLNTASYPQNPSAVAVMSFQVAVALWDSVVHYQTISQDQQLILVATWSCPTWVLHPSPFSDIFWAWCTCHVSCWWSRVAHRPSKFVKVVSSPSLGFVFNHQPLLQHGCLLFLLRASADSGFDTWWVTFEMA